MKAVFCDICGKPANRWYRIEITVHASQPYINVGDMIENIGEKEICSDCFKDKFLKNMGVKNDG